MIGLAAAPRRAAGISALVLMAALLRAALTPVSDLLGTAVFATTLLAIVVGGGRADVSEPRWGRRGSVLIGLGVGLVLLVPVLAAPLNGRPLTAFWSWAALAAVVASLEEAAIRGTLYRSWLAEVGPVAAILVGAAVFAAIHLARYGWMALPVDFAVGVALGGMRALTGRVLPGAIAHTIADWGAWFWA